VKELLKSSEDWQLLSAVEVIEAVAEFGAKYVKPFANDLRALVNHECFPVWCSARDLLFGLGENDIPPRPAKSLPASYLLELPEEVAEFSNIREEPELGEPLPDPVGYLEALKPFDGDLRLAARVLDRPPMQLLYRARQIMGELGSSTEWSAEAESALRSRLSQAGLEFTFHRPRGQFARLAMYRALTELFDARQMDPGQSRFIYERLRPFDPVLMLMRANVRPTEVIPIEGLTDHGNAGPEWVAAVRTATPRFVRKFGESHVIGEMTTLKRLAWEQPTIRVLSACVARDLGNGDELWIQYSRINVKAYSVLGRPGRPEHMVVMKEYDGRDTDCSHWIALNPVVGKGLGWDLADEGLFRWVNAGGELMAETIWWKDSTLDHRPPEFDDEVGEGWLVVVTNRALEAIRGECPQLVRITYNVRELSQEGQNFEELGKFTTVFPDNTGIVD
jgi:hypothetical protein